MYASKKKEFTALLVLAICVTAAAVMLCDSDSSDAVKEDAIMTSAPVAKEGLVFNGSAQELLDVTGAACTGGELQYSLSEDSGFSATVPTATAVSDSITVYYKVVGDSDHNDSAVASVTAKISPLEASGIRDVSAYGITAYLDTDNKVLTVAYDGVMPDVGTVSPWNNYNFATLVLTGDMKSVSAHAFEKCTTLRTVLFQNGAKDMTSMGDYSFSGCALLSSIDIPDAMTSIGCYAFQGCFGLTQITIPSGVSSIGTGTFSECYFLKDATFSANSKVSSIGECAFKGCKALLSIDLPSSVRTIGLDAFAGCTSMTALSVPAGVTTIFKGAFADLTSLQTLILGTDLPTDPYADSGSEYDGQIAVSWDQIFTYSNQADTKVFYDQNGVSFSDTGSHPDAVLTAGLYTSESQDHALYYHKTGTTGECTWELVNNCLRVYGEGAMADYTSRTPWGTDIGSATIEDGVTHVGNAAFYKCTVLQKAEMASSVTSIGENAFDSCTSLTTVTVGPDGAGILDIGNYAFCDCAMLATVSLPAYLSRIGNDAFDGCSALTTVTFNGGSYSGGPCAIGTYAFDGCTSIENIELPANTASIGYGCFRGCDSLTQVACMGNWSALDIDGKAFAGCNSLKKITMSGFNATIGDNVFDGCSALTSVEFGIGIAAVGAYAFNGCTSLAEVSTMAATEVIGEYAFCKCAALTSVTVGTNLTSVGSHAFDGCSAITSEMHLQKVATIGDYAFSECTKIPSFELGDSLTSVGAYAFYDCASAASVVMKGSPASIGDCTFRGCVALTSFTIPDSVKSVGKEAFYGCWSLQGISLPESVTGVGADAFANCGSVTSVHLGLSLANWSEVFTSSAGEHREFADQFDTRYGTNEALPAGDYTAGDRDKVFYYHLAGTSGDCAWEVCNGWLTVYGSGSMADYDSTGPWGTRIVGINIKENVLHIGTYAFAGCAGVERVNVTVDHYQAPIYIGAHAFEGCTGINQFIMPQFVAGIGDYAFAGCTHMTINIGYAYNNGATCAIGDYAFAGCTSFVDVEIPNNVTSIGSHAFDGCSALQHFQSHGLLSDIGDYAFAGCTSLVKVYFTGYSGSLKGAIGAHAFESCANLETVSLPAGFISVGDYAFSGCTAVSEIYIVGAEGKGTIGAHAFEGCASLTTLQATSDITSVGDNAFYKCGKLATIPVWVSLETVGDNTFTDCESISVDLDLRKVVSIGSCAFAGCSKVKSVVLGDSLEKLGDCAFSGCKLITTVSIPSSLDAIGKSVFSDCTSLTDVVIPETVTSIGYEAFCGCTSLKSIDLPSGLTSLGSYAFCCCSSLESITVPANVETIQEYTFDECSSLKSVTMSDKVTYIGDCAFVDCGALASVNFPAGLRHIGDSAFAGCSSLTEIKLGNKVTLIDKAAFDGCTSLTNLFLPSDLKNWSEVFSNIGKTFEVKIGETLPSESALPAGTYQAQGSVLRMCVGATGDLRWSLDGTVLTIYGEGAMASYTSDSPAPWGTGITEVVIKNGATSIGDYSFYGNSSLTKVTIPGSVTSVGKYAFGNCKNLASLALPDGITAIDEGTFGGCFFLSEIALPSNLQTIGDYAFNGCENLSSIELPSTLTSIGRYAFFECHGFKSAIPSSVKSINEFAFSKCLRLESVTIPAGAVCGYCAFKGCILLDSVVVEEGAYIGNQAFADCEQICSVQIHDDLARWQGVFGTLAKEFVDADGNPCTTATPDILPAGLYHNLYEKKDGLYWSEGHTPCNDGTDYYENGYHVISFTYCRDCNIILSLEQRIKCYSVAFQYVDHDGKTVGVSTTSYDVGTPAGKITLPEVPSDSYNDYWFDPADIKDVDSDAVYTARSSPRMYSVSFYMDDGTTLVSTGSYQYGTASDKIDVPAPTKEGTETVAYKFVGWNKAVADVTGDASYKAVFEQTTRLYTVTFVYHDPVLPSYITVSSTYEYNTPASEVKVPTVGEFATASYTYTFLNWGGEVSNVTEDHTYTANYKADINRYSVTFVFGEKTYTGVYDYGTHAGSIEVPDLSTYSTDKYTCTFISWDRAIEDVTGNASYVAECQRDLNTYTLTFVFGEKTFTETYVYGTAADKIEAPACESYSTEQYTYRFLSWETQFSDVTADATYTALYERTVNEYTITFGASSSMFISTQYEYGTSADTLLRYAPRISDFVKEGYRYSFTGWSPEVSDVTGDATYTAEFSKTLMTYTVTFMANGEVISSKDYDYGTPAEQIVKPVGVTKEGDAQYHYVFTGWNREITDVTSNAVYRAQFEQVLNEYTVTFLIDGADISTKSYVYGTKAADIDVPDAVKESTVQYDYDFNQWYPGITDVTGAAVYTAVFNEILRTYEITFTYGGEKYCSYSYFYGTTADLVWQAVDMSVYDDAKYVYTFAGFDRSIETVTGDAVYEISAVKTPRQYTVTFVIDGSVSSARWDYGTTAETLSSSVSPSKEGCTFSGWDSPLEEVTCDATYTALFETSRYTVTFVSDGKSISSKEYDYDEQIPAADIPLPAKAADKMYSYSFAGWDKDIVPVKTDATYTATFEQTPIVYTVVFMSEGKVFYSFEGHYGDAIITSSAGIPAKDGDAQFSYVFDHWSGATTTIEGDTTLTAVFRQSTNQYTVSFMSDGKVLSSARYDYGTEPSAIAVPGEVTKDADEQYTYAFAGWSSDIARVTENVTYVAQFTGSPRMYTVTFLWDGDVLSSTSYPYGTSAKDIAQPGARPSTVRCTYVLTGWDSEVSDVKGDAVYSAVYNTVTNRYTITFVCGSEVHSAEYDYGTLPADIVQPDTSRASTARYTYTFTGWDSRITMVVGDASYLAQYEKTVNQYKVTFVCGSRVYSAMYDYGTLPADIVQPNTTKTSTDRYTYSFVRWDQPVSTVVGNATYLAQYEITVNQYCVTFVSEGNVVSSAWYDYGTKAADIAVPEVSKEGRGEIAYTFAGWDSEISDVTGSATYTAVFERSAKMHTVTVCADAGGSVGEEVFEVEYGTPVVIDGDRLVIGKHVFTAVPDAAVGDRTFNFDEWVGISMITDDCTIVAVFSAVILPVVDEGGNASTDVSDLNMSYVIIIPEGAETLDVDLGDGCSVSVDVAGYARKTFHALMLPADNTTGYDDAIVYELDVTMDGSPYNGHMKVTVPVKTGPGDTVNVYYVGDAGLEEMKVVSAGDSVTFETTHNSRYAIVVDSPESDCMVCALAVFVALAIVAAVAVCMFRRNQN